MHKKRVFTYTVAAVAALIVVAIAGAWYLFAVRDVHFHDVYFEIDLSAFKRN